MFFSGSKGFTEVSCGIQFEIGFAAGTFGSISHTIFAVSWAGDSTSGGGSVRSKSSSSTSCSVSFITIFSFGTGGFSGSAFKTGISESTSFTNKGIGFSKSWLADGTFSNVTITFIAVTSGDITCGTS